MNTISIITKFHLCNSTHLHAKMAVNNNQKNVILHNVKLSYIHTAMQMWKQSNNIKDKMQLCFQRC